MTNGQNRTRSYSRTAAPIIVEKVDESNDALAVVLSRLMGANVVTKGEFDRVNSENQKLLIKANDIDSLRSKFFSFYCKFLAFKKYHSKWKPVTRNIERRANLLTKEKLIIDFSKYPKEISENLKEAYNCYVHGLHMACYIMVLRTIEIAVNILYEKGNPIEYDKNNKPKFIPAINKLNWVKEHRIIKGADYQVAKSFIEARNESVHEVYHPTEKGIMSAFETVIIIVNKIII